MKVFYILHYFLGFFQLHSCTQIKQYKYVFSHFFLPVQSVCNITAHNVLVLQNLCLLKSLWKIKAKKVKEQ